MKKLVVLATAILLNTSAFAIAPQIKITSFNYSDENSHVAELCGVVSAMTKFPTFLQVTIDEQSENPAKYNSLVGADGNFCLTVTTYAGTAIAKIL